MKTVTVSIAEGKKDFTKLIKEAAEGNRDILVTKRGKPMAVIIPYEEYQHSKKIKAYRQILKSREAFAKTGLSSEEVYEESKAVLERSK